METCINNINNDLKAVSEWLKINQLILNAEKTKCMIINENMSETSLNVIVDNVQIEVVDKVKYLGIMLDKKLTLSEHVDYMCRKISQKIGVLRKIRQNVSMNCAVKVYNVIIKPHFEYCGSILFTCPEYQKKRLQVLQNRAMRIIIKCDRYTPVTFMLNSLNWLSINQRLFMCAILCIHKIKNGTCPNYLLENVTISDSSSYNLRSVGDLRVQRARTTRGQRTMSYMGFQAFNSLPTHLKQETNFHIFKRKIIVHIRTNVN